MSSNLYTDILKSSLSQLLHREWISFSKSLGDQHTGTLTLRLRPQQHLNMGNKLSNGNKRSYDDVINNVTEVTEDHEIDTDEGDSSDEEWLLNTSLSSIEDMESSDEEDDNMSVEDYGDVVVAEKAANGHILFALRFRDEDPTTTASAKENNVYQAPPLNRSLLNNGFITDSDDEMPGQGSDINTSYSSMTDADEVAANDSESPQHDGEGSKKSSRISMSTYETLPEVLSYCVKCEKPFTKEQFIEDGEAYRFGEVWEDMWVCWPQKGFERQLPVHYLAFNSFAGFRAFQDVNIICPECRTADWEMTYLIKASCYDGSLKEGDFVLGLYNGAWKEAYCKSFNHVSQTASLEFMNPDGVNGSRISDRQWTRGTLKCCMVVNEQYPYGVIRNKNELMDE